MVQNGRKLRIAVAGAGYVGLSIAVLLSQHSEVVAVDIMKERVDMINKRISPVRDEYIERFFAGKELDLTATTDAETAYAGVDFVVIAVPTDYDFLTQQFDTKAVEQVIEQVMAVSDTAFMVIKSTVPVGYTQRIREKYDTDRVLFSPEFLRESLEYSCAMKSHFRKSGNQMSGKWKSSYASLLA